MAVYECDYSRHRYPEAQQSIYFTHLIGRIADTYKMRLCPKHFREVAIMVEQEMAELDEASQSSATCDRCENQRAGSLFAKVFGAKTEMRQFVADFCAAHLSTVGNDLRIFNGDHFSNA